MLFTASATPAKESSSNSGLETVAALSCAVFFRKSSLPVTSFGSAKIRVVYSSPGTALVSDLKPMRPNPAYCASPASSRAL